MPKMHVERSRAVRRRNTQPQIDLVPLMDTIFLLLFFFLCAAIVQSGALSAKFNGQGDELEKYQTVTITSQNITGLDNIGAEPVVIKADSDVNFGKVDEVLHLLQEKGLSQVNFAL